MKLLRRPELWIVLVLALVGAVAAFYALQPPAVKVARVERKDLEHHLVASGRVRVPTRVQIAAQVPGLVVLVTAVEGEHVKAGDLLVQIDDAEESAAVLQAEAGVKQASARVTQLRKVGAIVATEALGEAQTNLERAEVELERTKSLVEGGSLPTSDLENARRAVSIARAQRAATAAQQIASQPMGADSRVALTALMQAQAQLEGAKVRLEQTRIIAFQDGTVLSRSVEPGDVVQPARTLLVLAADGNTELGFQADERNLAYLHVGQAARASADAYPQQVFDARVSYIAPSIDPQRGSVEVRLEVEAPPEDLRPDMTVSIDLLVAAKSAVLTVPTRVVHGMSSSSPWVLVVEDGRAVRREVTLGIRGEGSVEIVSGLNENDEVIDAGTNSPVEGERVRTVQG